jgi:cysteine synthase A
MNIRPGFVGTIGNTPLIRLERLSEETGCEILGKAEFLNPGGSVKDRAAQGIIEAAEKAGELQAGGTVVEGTAGNTGIGLAHICNARGYRCLIVIPETQSQEKIGLLLALGAEVRTVPAVPYRNPGNYQKVAGRLADEMQDAIWANQFDNTANRDIHMGTTGPEIVLADPMGSGLYSWVKTGDASIEGASITEGIGNSRVTANLEGTPIDDAVRVADPDCVRIVYRLLHEEGLFVGGSTGINVSAAVEVARGLGPGHTVVTVLCDGGARYQSRLFNLEWLREKGLAEYATRRPRRH